MSHLAFLGSHRVNGVSALHTGLMRETVFRDLHNLFPDRIVNVTNGIAFRRWLFEANPRLTRLLSETVGPRVLEDENALTALQPLASDRAFQKRFATCRYVNKLALADLIRRELEIRVDPNALFDVHIKRIHEYKRQLLNILEAIALYNAIRARPMDDWTPRVKIFAGKAAASYYQAKLVIKLIHDVAKVVNNDPTVRNILKIAFVPNYSVSLAELIIPATDVSEQISTAGMEASGTGNMKFGLNGALTIGTLDGANVEMLEAVGEQNFFLFGLRTEQVAQARESGYDPMQVYYAEPMLRAALDAVSAGMFSPDDPHRFKPIVDSLLYGGDSYLLLADFLSYVHCQRSVEAAYHDQAGWTRRSILNVAHLGRFSSDRTILGYARDIWGVYVPPIGGPRTSVVPPNSVR